jgi:hypothetical protein
VTVSRIALLTVVVAGVLAGCARLPTHEELVSSPGPQAALSSGRSVIDGRGRFRDIFCEVLARPGATTTPGNDCSDWLWRLDDEPVAAPAALPTPDRTPQVYLVSGAFSECLGEEAKPFHGATDALVAAGYRISTIVVGGRSGPVHNAGQIAERLAAASPGEEGPVVLIGYSKGAVDILEFLVRYPELAARVRSVVSVAGAIGGSPLAAQAGSAYDLLLGWVPSGRCPAGDGGVIDSLRVQTRRDWLANNALPGHIRYFSVAAFTTRERMASALVPAWESLLRHDLRNDGQLLARDALIPGSMLLGYANADHWSVAIDIEVAHAIIAGRQDPRPYPRAALLEAILLQLAETGAPPGESAPTAH